MSNIIWNLSLNSAVCIPLSLCDPEHRSRIWITVPDAAARFAVRESRIAIASHRSRLALHRKAVRCGAPSLSGFASSEKRCGTDGSHHHRTAPVALGTERAVAKACECVSHHHRTIALAPRTHALRCDAGASKRAVASHRCRNYPTLA